MKRVAVVLSVLPLALAACAGSAGDDDRPHVVASFYPYAFVAEQIGGRHIVIENLTTPGSEPHDVELKPQQVAAVQDADLVVYQREFQPAVDEAVDQAGRSADAVIDAATLVDLHGADEHGPAEDDGHDHDSLDPHVWLDPNNLVPIARAVADRLATTDPDHAETYRANADALVGELEALDTAFRDGLADCERDTIVTSHSAFGYLAQRYGLEQLSIAGIDPGNEPSGKQLAAITDQVKAHGITTVFTEELVDPANAETIASATGVTIATLDPIEGLGPNTADQTYLTLMQHNLDALRAANSCR
ncbi:MAG TPA: metal ABC transporter substrate-binding protein [Aeromicrobium sp.]|nr:metal ABC transporter substrate-binding protein [Aeromicrobium sp.]